MITPEQQAAIYSAAALYGVEPWQVSLTLEYQKDFELPCYTVSVYFRRQRARKNERGQTDSGYGDTLRDALDSLRRSYEYRVNIGDLPKPEAADPYRDRRPPSATVAWPHGRSSTPRKEHSK